MSMKLNRFTQLVSDLIFSTDVPAKVFGIASSNTHAPWDIINPSRSKKSHRGGRSRLSVDDIDDDDDDASDMFVVLFY
jgi:hypothetical protein